MTSLHLGQAATLTAGSGTFPCPRYRWRPRLPFVASEASTGDGFRRQLTAPLPQNSQVIEENMNVNDAFSIWKLEG